MLQKRHRRGLILKQTNNQRIKFHIKLNKSRLYSAFFHISASNTRPTFTEYFKFTLRCEVWVIRKLFPTLSAILPWYQCVDIDLTHLTVVHQWLTISQWCQYWSFVWFNEQIIAGSGSISSSVWPFYCKMSIRMKTKAFKMFHPKKVETACTPISPIPQPENHHNITYQTHTLVHRSGFFYRVSFFLGIQEKIINT